MENRVCKLFGIKYPVIQGGMVWVSGAKLAAAVSNAGGLGLLGAGSMKPDLLREHIKKAKTLTDKPFGVNIPIFSKYSEDQVRVSLEEGVRIFFMSAGSPKKFTGYLKEKGCIVVHVTSTPTLAKKCEDAGVDAVVVEGFEAGGHNGRDELTTFVLIPQTKKMVKIPVIAAGGIATGQGIVAAFALGADGVQIGTRFAATIESSAHENYKKALVNARDTDTMLYLKSIIPVRLVKNSLTVKIEEMEKRCADVEEFKKVIGENAAKRAIFDGDTENGEIEAGQVAGLIDDVPSVNEVFETLIMEVKNTMEMLNNMEFSCF